MTKTLNQIFFSLHSNQNIFFINIGNQNIFLEKNHTPLQVKWSFPNECGFSHIYETELFNKIDYLKCVIKQRLEDQSLQNWIFLVHNSPKIINYKTLKAEFKYEEYLNILEIKDAICYADLEQLIIISPSRQDHDRTYQEKIVNVNYVIDLLSSPYDTNTQFLLDDILYFKFKISHICCHNFYMCTYCLSFFFYIN